MTRPKLHLELVLHHDARSDLNLAIARYESLRPGLGVRFLTKVDRAIAFITQFPHAFKTREARFGSIPVSRFPYKIVYCVRDERVIVIGVLHDKNQPAQDERQAAHEGYL